MNRMEVYIIPLKVAMMYIWQQNQKW